MSNKQIMIMTAAIVTIIISVAILSTDPQYVQACKLKSEMTLEDAGLFGMDNLTINEKGVVEGFYSDYSNASVPCDSIGEALDSGYTMDEIQLDLLMSSPL